MNIEEYQNYHETKRHTELSFPYNTYLCSIPLDFIHVPAHWHDEVELIVIKKGKGQVMLDLQTHTVTEGEMVLILPGHLHSISEVPGHSMEYENILFLPSLLTGLAGDLCTQQYLAPLFAGDLRVTSIFDANISYYAEYCQLIHTIDTLCSEEPLGYQLGIKGLLYQFFFLLVQNAEKDSRPLPERKSFQKLKTIIKYIEDHYASSVTIEDMAQITYYSKSHFMKFFKTNMGMGFTEYLNNYRLTIAARLLRSSDDSVLDIAEQCGFGNLSYFNRLFKRKYGDSPRHYRKGTGTF